MSPQLTKATHYSYVAKLQKRIKDAQTRIAIADAKVNDLAQLKEIESLLADLAATAESTASWAESLLGAKV